MDITKLKRLELRLPEDHFLFQVVPGMRTSVAIRMLDMSYRLMMIEQQLSELQSIVSKAQFQPPASSSDEKKTKTIQNIIDVFDIDIRR